MLAFMLANVGRTAEALSSAQTAARLEPLSPSFRYALGLSLWYTGRLQEADAQMIRSLALWPRDLPLWFSRFWTLTLSGRGGEAAAMLDRIEGRPVGVPDADFDLCRLCAQAIETRSADMIRSAEEANLAAAHRGFGYALNAIQVLSMLGRLNSAFTIARAAFLSDGFHVGPTQFTALQGAHGMIPRTAILFCPACEALRPDPRFARLCRDMGLEDYWRRVGVAPDFRRAG